MATKKSTTRRKATLGSIPQQYETRAAREEAAANQGDRYLVDLSSTAPDSHYVIRDRASAEIVEHCPTVTRAEIEWRVAVLNRGNPTRGENLSWGKMTKERAKTGRVVKSSNPQLLSATEWVERLVGDPHTSTLLREYEKHQRVLTDDELARLVAQVAERDRVLPDDLEPIRQQLWRKFGIRRADDHR